MNPDTAFVANRGMSLSQFEWTMVETALLAYAHNKLGTVRTKTDVQIIEKALDLAKRINYTNGIYTQHEAWAKEEEEAE